MPEGYCVKERKKVEIKDPQQVTMKNGRPAIQGTCPDCGTKIFKIGKLEARACRGGRSPPTRQEPAADSGATDRRPYGADPPVAGDEWRIRVEEWASTHAELAEAARADPRAQPADQRLDARVPGRRATRRWSSTTRPPAALLGRSFEDAGRMSAERVDGARSARSTRTASRSRSRTLATTEAIRDGRPAHGELLDPRRRTASEHRSRPARSRSSPREQRLVRRDDPLLAARRENGDGRR